MKLNKSARLVLAGIYTTLAVLAVATLSSVHAIIGTAQPAAPFYMQVIWLNQEHQRPVADDEQFSNVTSHRSLNLADIIGDDLGVQGWERPYDDTEELGYIAVAPLGSKCTAAILYGTTEEGKPSPGRYNVTLMSEPVLVGAANLSVEDARSFYALRPYQSCE